MKEKKATKIVNDRSCGLSREKSWSIIFRMPHIKTTERENVCSISLSIAHRTFVQWKSWLHLIRIGNAWFYKIYITLWNAKWSKWVGYRLNGFHFVWFTKAATMAPARYFSIRSIIRDNNNRTIICTLLKAVQCDSSEWARGLFSQWGRISCVCLRSNRERFIVHVHM